MEYKQDALNWSLTYLQAVVGSDIEENEEYIKALQLSETEDKWERKMKDNVKEVLETLEALVKALGEKKLDVKKDFSLMVADSQARKLLHKYREAV